MLHIILLILKIIVIILLCIVGLVLAVLAAVLFVPIRYRADLSIYEYGTARCRISWMLHIVSAEIRYGKQKNGEMGLIRWIKVFGIKLPFFQIKAKKDKEYKKEKKKKQSFVSDYEPLVNEKTSREKDALFITEDHHQHFAAPDDGAEECDEQIYNEKSTESKSWFKKFNFKKILDKIRKILFKIKSLCGKIKSVAKKSQDIREFINREETREALKFIKAQAGILAGHIKPHKIKGHLRFGTGDPAYTAEFLGIYHLIFRGRYPKMIIEPDFDNRVVDGEIHVSGKIVIFRLLILALRVYKNENLKKTIKIGKNLKEEL